MSKLILDPILSDYASRQKFNSNFDSIEDAVENTLSRDGSSPNQMEANLDMNSHNILNLPYPASVTEPVRLGDLVGLISIPELNLNQVAGIVSSLAGLRGFSVSAGHIGLLIYVTGYSSVNDGGQGYFYVTSSPSSDDGGTLITSNTSGFYFVRLYSGALNAAWFGAVGGGNYSTALTAAEAARVAGQDIFVTPSTFSLSAPVTFNKAGKLIIDGCTITSTAANLIITTSNFIIQGYEATFTYASGDPALSLDRAIRIGGAATGPFNINTAIALGDTSFVVTNSGQAATVSNGDWVICATGVVGNFFAVDFMQVASVSGTTINVTTPFRTAMAANAVFVWYKLTSFVDYSGVKGLKIITTNAVTENVGLDVQVARHVIFEDCKLDIKLGNGGNFYLTDSLIFEKNVILRQGNRQTNLSSSVNAKIRNNILEARDAPTHGFLNVETGSNFNLIEGNTVRGIGGGNDGITSHTSNSNTYRDNFFNGNGTCLGLHVHGGKNNLSTGNQYINCGEAIRWINEVTVSVTADDNVSDGDRFSNCTYCIDVGSGTGNKIFDINDDGTNTTLVADGGTQTVYDSNQGLSTNVPTLSFITAGDLSVAYSTPQFLRTRSYGQVREFCLCLVCTPTFTTASGGLAISAALPAAKNVTGLTQTLSGTVTGWTRANYTHLTPYMNPNDSRIFFQLDGSGQSARQLQASDLASGSQITIFVNGRYEINL